MAMDYRRWATVVWLCAAAVAPAEAAPAPSIHPAVVRIMAAENGGAAFGSGTLVAVNQRYGLVITNWHVVRDSNGFVVVSFPGGFRSPATVIRTDRDWDLAALAIWRPNVAPISISTQAPQPGETLTIAGYGKGAYRAASGRCTQYLSPGGRLPFEMVEVATPARNGDSGGPIFNSRGELAGVLFGTGMGRTMGSYCGRVQAFLDPLFRQMIEMDRMETPDTMIAARPSAGGLTGNVRAGSAGSPTDAPASTPWRAPPQAVVAQPGPLVAVQPFDPPFAASSDLAGSSTRPPLPLPEPDFPAASQPQDSGAAPAQTASLPSAGPLLAAEPVDRFAGLKTFLAMAGAVLLTFHAVRFLGRAVG
jgi:hypothetical protein